MSEMGEDFRRQRQQRQAFRRTLVACDLCGFKSQADEPCFKCFPDEWLRWNADRKKATP